MNGTDYFYCILCCSVFDLLNIHLFHDASNLVSIELVSDTNTIILESFLNIMLIITLLKVLWSQIYMYNSILYSECIITTR